MRKRFHCYCPEDVFGRSATIYAVYIHSSTHYYYITFSGGGGGGIYYLGGPL